MKLRLYGNGTNNEVTETSEKYSVYSVVIIFTTQKNGS